MSSLKYWVWLSSFSGVSAATASALLRHFGTPENIFTANKSDYMYIDGVKSSDLTELLKKDPEPANKALAACREAGCRVITMQDTDYPDRLRNIYDPPLVLYVRGSLPAIDEEPVVAIVGTRRCTAYGLKAAENIGYSLAKHGVTVVTGLAKGIDSAAIRGALRAGGRAVGVIGSGVDVVYPPENKALFTETAARGAVISEYPPGTPAVAWHFPARNRIISGLALGTLVIEAPKKSGALITAARALEHGRDVFVLPANVDSKASEGSNSLLREGAIPVLSAEDILTEYAELYPNRITLPGAMNATGQSADDGRGQQISIFTDTDTGAQYIEKKEIDNEAAAEYIDLGNISSKLNGDERKVAEAIGAVTMHVDDIISKSGLSAQQVLTALTMLEISGHVSQSVGKYYKLII